MGRPKKQHDDLILSSVHLIYDPAVKEKWLQLCVQWVEDEVRKKLREGEESH
jgi:hypothetical protein